MIIEYAAEALRRAWYEKPDKTARGSQDQPIDRLLTKLCILCNTNN